MKRGQVNNTDQVLRLQVFLKVNEGINVPFNGVFDAATEQGVKDFQERYRSDILEPWGPGTPASGYVYVLTKWKINQILCGDMNRPGVVPAQRTAAPAASKEGGSVSKEGGKEGGAAAIDAELASSTPEKPFIIGVQTSETNIAGVGNAVKDTDCRFWSGKHGIRDTLLLLPRAISCALGLDY